MGIETSKTQPEPPIAKPKREPLVVPRDPSVIHAKGKPVTQAPAEQTDEFVNDIANQVYSGTLSPDYDANG